ncbi:MAG: pantoate--beta-alanine ligase [Defluviitaleaceae bacterium]|nr:pantoate--beta-alanine ligase [Defluviitaleaceae bacterium]
MEIIKTIQGICKANAGVRKETKIGFVPTMGYLHEGHASLIKRAKSENDIVVVSIFVNPMQFAPNEDLATYPRNLEKDAKLCEILGVDYLFAPDSNEIYGENFFTQVSVPSLNNKLCGITRPTHFSGVCTVVLKLFNIVKPTNAYFGLKDFQQYTIIKTMVQNLNLSVNIVGCDIIREESGLALSSRNSYLSEKEKEDALVLYEAILYANESAEKNAEQLITELKEIIQRKARIDYIEMVDEKTLEPIEIVDRDCRLIMAAYVGNTRLIDNFKINGKK